MSLAPLWQAAAIQLHALAAMAAFAIGGTFTFYPGRIMHAVVFGR